MKRWPRRSVDYLCRRRQARLADAGLRRPVLLFFDVPLPAGLAEDRDTLRADLSRYFAGWAPPVQKLIAALDPQTTNRIEIHDIEPFSRLVRGRVALLGDAGHSTTPDIGGRLRGDGRCSRAGRRFPPDPRYCGRPARV